MHTCLHQNSHTTPVFNPLTTPQGFYFYYFSHNQQQQQQQNHTGYTLALPTTTTTTVKPKHCVLNPLPPPPPHKVTFSFITLQNGFHMTTPQTRQHSPSQSATSLSCWLAAHFISSLHTSPLYTSPLCPDYFSRSGGDVCSCQFRKHFLILSAWWWG